jgi:Tfp pilus assembly protein PilF
MSYIRSNQPKEAIAILEKGLKLNFTEKKTVELKAWLGIASVFAGAVSQSKKTCQDVVRADPNSAEGHFCLGLSYLGLGDKVSALDEYKILKTMGSDFASPLFKHIYP